MDFIFSTPTLLNADVENPGQLSSCFILSMKDSIESICECDAHFTKIFQKNGGAGADMSVLRPTESVVNTSKGYAGGAVSFMHKFDNTAYLMTRFNPSRKGAIKIDLQVWHPDIFNFIHAKDDTNELPRINISVALTDDFMEAVLNDGGWNLEFPDYEICKEVYDAEWDGDLSLWKSKGYPVKIYQYVEARALFREIVTAAWETGEPGVNFKDTMSRDNKNKHISTLVGTNPCSEFTNIPYSACLTADTLVMTPDGVREIGKLVGIKTKVYSTDNRFRDCHSIVSKGNKDVYELTLSNGLKIRATKDHRFLTLDGWKEVQELTTESNIKILNNNPLIATDSIDEKYEMFGWMHGDGWFNNTIGITFNYADGDWEVKERLLPIFLNTFKVTEGLKPLKDDSVSYQIQTNKQECMKIAEELGAVRGTTLTKCLPTSFYTWGIIQQVSFIRGLFTADSGLYGRIKRDIAFATSSETLVNQLQKFLASIGIYSRVTYMHCKNRSNPQYRLTIARESSYKYMNLIGFSCSKKTDDFYSTTSLKKVFDDPETLTVKSIRYPRGIKYKCILCKWNGSTQL
jgi:ribonucleoside-diphosphate reductase alpha chain